MKVEQERTTFNPKRVLFSFLQIRFFEDCLQILNFAFLSTGHHYLRNLKYWGRFKQQEGLLFAYRRKPLALSLRT